MKNAVLKMVFFIYAVYIGFLTVLILTVKNDLKNPVEIKKTVKPSQKKDTLRIIYYEKTIN